MISICELNADFSLNCIFYKSYWWREYGWAFTHIRFNEAEQTVQIIKMINAKKVFKLFEV